MRKRNLALFFIICIPYLVLVFLDWKNEEMLSATAIRLEYAKLQAQQLEVKLAKLHSSKSPYSSDSLELASEMKERLEQSEKRVGALISEIEKLEQKTKEQSNDNSEQIRKSTTSNSQLVDFDIKNYKDKTFDEMIQDYCVFHKQMIDGLIPAKFLYLEIGPNVGSEGFGNRIERVAWSFLLALLSGRAFVMKFEDTYFVSNEHFSGPGFDWNYHKNDKFQELPKTNSNFQNPAFHSKDIKSYFNDPVLSFTAFQRSFELPGSGMLSNEHYKHIIPHVLGNWKSTIIRYLFSKPSENIINEVEGLKTRIKEAGYNKIMTVQFRSWGYTQAVRSEDVYRYIDCMKALTEGESDRAYFLATDNLDIRQLMSDIFKEKLFFLDVRPEGPNSPEFRANFKEDHKITGSLGVFVDWYMLGEGDMIVHTAASSYGISAADRGNISSYPNRFVMGGLTQCTDPKQAYYKEKIYISPLETYEQKGVVEWIPFIQ